MHEREDTDHDFDGHQYHDDHLEELVPAAAGLIAEEAVHLSDTSELDIDMTLPVR